MESLPHPKDLHSLLGSACDAACKLHQDAHQVEHAIRASVEGGLATHSPEPHKATPGSPQRVG